MQVDLLDERHYSQAMRKTVLPALDACRSEGWFTASAGSHDLHHHDPGKIHYVCFDAHAFDALHISGATAIFRGAVVISHGLTEFAEKFNELAWYFLLAGYSVCIIEHRGHGQSARDVADPDLVWIDDWNRYAEDMSYFCSQIAQEYADGLPLCLFAHSMGGGIGAAVLEQRPTIFDKAVLSSPMIAPRTGLPNWLAAAFVSSACAAGFSKRMAPGQRPFVASARVQDVENVSASRANWFHALRMNNMRRHTSAPTYGWVRESLKLSHSVLQPGMCARIETPVLVFQSGNDDYVLNPPQNRFVQQVRDGGCPAELIRVDNGPHELYSMPNPAMGPYIDRMISFFNDPIRL
ncbi:alpha/beta fold hydrolase [Bifidobacterium aquikefiricola]|uniref:Alpha/beta fold hydrolase n=1 Tax=Bifidobacterium aquikefiricola TaxID=3059038 RepID=A0AB39U7B5_9BIFI